MSRSPRREYEDATNTGNTVHVKNLSIDITKEDLRAIFSKVGEIVNVDIPVNPHTNEGRGFAFLTFESNQDAERAIREFDGYLEGSKRLIVSLARRSKPREPTPGQYLGSDPDSRSRRSRYESRDSGYGGYGGGRDRYDDRDRGYGDRYRDHRPDYRDRMDRGRDYGDRDRDRDRYDSRDRRDRDDYERRDRERDRDRYDRINSRERGYGAERQDRYRDSRYEPYRR